MGSNWFKYFEYIHIEYKITNTGAKVSGLIHKALYILPCAYQGVRNVGFSERFVYMLNG